MSKKTFNPFYTNCRSCNERIIMLLTINKKHMPVNVSSLSEQEKDDIGRGANFFFDGKKHETHFATCPEANKWRREKSS